ncbi:MAG: M23 family metallopeptidase [Acidobacteria bacterium]|nr:MAG: M23 family metallopeptidase [Acidobacteriota bacterium]
MDGEGRREKRGKKLRWIIGAVLVALVVVVTFRVGSAPQISIEPALPGIGRRTPVAVVFEESSRGLGRIQVELVQGQLSQVVAEEEYRPRAAWKFWGPRIAHAELELEIGSDTVDGIEPGEATVRASAWPAPTWLRRPDPVVQELSLPVRLIPPALEVVSMQNYVARGGAGVVVYRVGESAVRDGVEIEANWFPGYPLPGGDSGERFSLYGVPFDLENGDEIRLIAEDDVLNRSSRSFVERFFAKGYKTDNIQITDQFMEKVVPAILEQTPGIKSRDSLLESYLEINGELRRQNTETLTALGESSRREFLWDRPFFTMPNAQVMSAFADRRTYVYEGEPVDQQDHLGFDLASVRRAEVPAANRGIVVLARYLGIYGNAVVIDHGYGLMSLYGHLSSLEVSEGQTVERGQTVGRTGETGLAGGDHLHFTMLVRGESVTPVEWWDAKWIRDRFAAKLGESFPFKP